MNRIKKALGFDSPYSWVKWLRMSFAAVALLITAAFLENFGSPALDMIMDGGIIHGIIGIILLLGIFILLFGPTLAILLGAAALIGTLIGGTRSVQKQRQSFKETYATGSTELIALEKLRLKSQVLDALLLVTAVALVILGFFFGEDLYDAFGEAGFYGYWVVAAIILIGFWLAKVPVNLRYKNAFKEQVVAKGLQSVLDNVDFQPANKLDESIIRAAALFPQYDIYSGNDYLAADYHGHHFVQSDVHLQEEREETYRDSDDELQTRTVYVSVFRGRLMVFDYDAISNELVAVYDRRGGKPKSSKAIQTELDAFNRKFSISAPSPTAALRILTPPVLEGIVLAAGKLGYPLDISFKDDKLYVALTCGDAFEAAGGDITLSEQRRRVTGEIKTMLDFVDTLYLEKPL